MRNEDQGTTIRGVLYTLAAISPKPGIPKVVKEEVKVEKESVDSPNGPETVDPVTDGDNLTSLVNSNVPEDPKFTTPPTTPETVRKSVVSSSFWCLIESLI